MIRSELEGRAFGRLTLRAPRPSDAADLGPRLRAADAAELMALDGLAGTSALVDALELSEAAWAVDVDGELAGLFGAREVAYDRFPDSSAALVWLLGSQELELAPFAFLAASRVSVREMLDRWDVLRAYVDARYVTTLRWLALLGFRDSGRTAHGQGPGTLPFREMEICNGWCQRPRQHRPV